MGCAASWNIPGEGGSYRDEEGVGCSRTAAYLRGKEASHGTCRLPRPGTGSPASISPGSRRRPALGRADAGQEAAPAGAVPPGGGAGPAAVPAALARRPTDPDAAIGHAPAHHPRPLLLGYRVHTLLCRGTGLPLLFCLSTAKVHDAPFARPLLELAVRLLPIRPRVIRLDAAYWGLKLIAWIHTTLGAVAVIPWNPKRQQRRNGLPPTWTAQELGKRTSIERFFGRVLVFFRLQRPPVFGSSAMETRGALTYAAVLGITLAAWQAGCPDLIRSPRLVLAHVCEGVE